MLKRPTTADTEEDLLAFQQSFLSSGGRPAASVATVPRAGEKRKQLQQGEHLEDRGRDVVQLQAGDLPSTKLKPPTKKSKFKERRQKSKEKNERGFKDPFEAMERHDRHITKILSDIKEHDSGSSVPISLPTRLTRHGFPTVHELDLKAISKTTEAPSKGVVKKSLFAQQFESHNPEYFGLELHTPLQMASVQRDVVEPVNLGGAGRRVEEHATMRSEGSPNSGIQSWSQYSENDEKKNSGALGRHVDLRETESKGVADGHRVPDEVVKESLREGMEVVPPGGTQERSDGGTGILPPHLGGHSGNGGGNGSLLKEEFASEASQTWTRFLQSAVISGEGLMSVGVAPEVAQEEVGKIHQENVEKLSCLSEQEILEEQDRIRKLLGPDLVSFFHSRRVKQEERGDEKEEEEMKKEEEGGGTQEDVAVDLEDEGVWGGGEGGRREIEPMEHGLGDLKEDKGVSGVSTAPHSWLHMEVLERDKMEWMTDVPLHPQPTEGLTSKEVRFSLEGLVIPQGTAVPPHLGLHHHGEEPEAAGYTLNELLHLSRSTVLQQRVFSLQILARIIRRARQNEYGHLVDGSLLRNLLEAGVPMMLRYSLDDGLDTVIMAAVLCIHGLLVMPVEEYLLDEYCCCQHGNTLPALRSHDQSCDLKEKEEEEEEKEEKESDAEIMQRDIVEGYLQVKLPHRLRYILEVCRPSSTTTALILEVLTRICRHSMSAASKVLHCPRLMTVVFEEFLPLAWNEDQDSDRAHGRPHTAAMKLVQAVCAAGRNLAAHLVSHHKLMSVVTRYTVLHPSELSLPEEDAYDLSIATLRTWSTVLCYGIGSETLRDTYAVFLKQLQLMASSSLFSLGWREVGRVTALLGLMDAAIHIAAITPSMLKIEGEGNLQLPPPALIWSHTTGMLTPLLHCLSSWVDESSIGTQQLDRMPCVGSLLHCVASYYSKLSSKLPENLLDVLQQIETIASMMDKCAESLLFSTALQALRTTSRLANPPLLSDEESPLHSLPTHLTLPPPPKPPLYCRATMERSDFHKMVQPRVTCFTASNLLLGHVRLCLAIADIHKGVTNKVTTIFSKSLFQDYLKAVVQRPMTRHSCFEFGEMQLLYCTMKLFTKWLELPQGGEGGVEEGVKQLCHHLGFKLLSLLPPGMEHYVHDLLSTVVFHPRLLCDLSSSLVDKYIDVLSLKDPPHPITISPSTPSFTTSGLLSESQAMLPSIQNVYLQAMERGGVFSKQGLSKSRAWLEGYPLATGALQLPPHCGPLLPLDWPLLPIIMEYNSPIKRDSVAMEASTDVVSMVTHSLHFILLLELLRPHMLRELPPGSRLARIMCTFLIGNDLFLERRVHSCLSALLAAYCREKVQKSLDFRPPIPGLDSFQDLYVSLLSQYAAVSYGDPLFSCFLLLPLQQRFGPQLRKVVWGEHPSVLRLLSLPISQVPVKVEEFLYPLETDGALLEMYMTAVATAIVRPEWSPVFYLVAVHHIHSFVFQQSQDPSSLTPLQMRLLQGVLKLKNEDSRNHLLLYGGLDEGSKLGFFITSRLPDFQRSRVLSLLGETIELPGIPGLQ